VGEKHFSEIRADEKRDATFDLRKADTEGVRENQAAAVGFHPTDR
jgi:hypothetical protein